MEKVAIFDTTLRDGEQSPGASMDVEQKFEMALQLERLGVDVMEAGFPVSSPHQFEACKRIASTVTNSTVAVLCRSNPKDIEVAAESIQNARRGRIHTFISTSPIHMKHKLQKEPDEVLEMAEKAVKLARNYTDDVEFSPEDATRTDPDFLCKIVELAVNAGATVINIPDTVGYTVPNEIANTFRMLRERVPNMDKAVLSAHCHDDLGLAVANTISAIEAGARQAEVTINGIGERAGNAALEEVVMALNVRRDALNLETNVNSKQIYQTSRMLSTMIGFPIARNKAVVGENAFSHEAGIHQHGVLANRQTYEIMTPESVGRAESRLVLGRHSGMHGFKKRLDELGIEIPDEEVKRVYERFLEVADRKKEVYDEDLYAIVSDEMGRTAASLSLEYINVITGNTAVPTATVRVRTGDDETHEEASTGDGPVDAIFRAIDRALQVKPTLEEYNVHAISPGKQAMGEVSVVLSFFGERMTGRGSSTDILEASARAYVNAINRYNTLREVKSDETAVRV